MPAHTVLYNREGTPIYKFGSHHRNTITWAPDGDTFALCGFENLKGEIDIFRLSDKKKLGTCSSNLASYLKWSPDSKYFMTAIVHKKLKVGNEFKIFTQDCTFEQKFSIEDDKHLFYIYWVKGDSDSYNDSD